MKRTNCCTYSTLPPLPSLTMGADQFAPFASERLFTAEEAAEYLKVEVRTLCKFITSDRANKLKASWVGRRWLITESALRNFLAGNEQDVSEKK
jgi:excisionase family DNA binding protein